MQKPARRMSDDLTAAQRAEETVRPMADPRRIRRRRTKGWRMPEGAVCVDRSTKWGNPWRVGGPTPLGHNRKVQDNRHAASIYLGFAPESEALCAAAKAELRGRDLACWCALCDIHADGKPLGVPCPYCEPCHADTLLEIANG
jgi:hypothetical protein